ncbi:MAG: helix-turn-helix domain-containing protein, partial [Thermodesulfovibrionales bacterium]
EELASHFLGKYAQKLSKPVTGFTQEVLQSFNSYEWPGNVRELENVVERAVILCDSDLVGPEDIAIPAALAARDKASQGASLEDVEREHILRVLQECRGNQSRASQILGIDRKTLYLKLRKYGISDQAKSSSP